MIRHILFFVSLIFFFSATNFAQKTEHVFVLVIDGVRYSETFGDSLKRYVPYMSTYLQPLGKLNTACYNNGQTLTVPGHASILTGTWQQIYNDGSQRPTKPTILEHLSKEKLIPAEQLYLILGKAKLSCLSYSIDSSYGVNYQASLAVSATATNDTLTYTNLLQIAQEHHPLFTLVNFSAPDIIGHSGDFNKYTNAVRYLDSVIVKFWDFIQADSVFKNKTTVIITNDHGRHLDSIAGGFAGHGDACLGCRHIMYLEIGPDTPPNITDAKNMQQIDIVDRVALLLNVNMSNIITDISENNSFVLTAYPNPFKESTVISYKTNLEIPISINIFDEQMIPVVCHQILNSSQNTNRFIWDGKDQQGLTVAAGKYYVQINDANEKSMIQLIKIE